jgi:subtilisin
MNDNLSPRSAQTTGRYLVLMQEGEEAAGMAALREMVGAGEIDDSAMSRIGVAVVSLDPNQLQSVRVAVADDSQPIVAMEAERMMYAIGDNSIDVDTTNYLRGYRDGVNHLVDSVIGSKSASQEQQATISAFVNDTDNTWGLQATQVSESSYSGGGIKIAVLDTGLDLTHPDFVGRTITSRSFVSGVDVQDLNGHGTHCIGTACGLDSSDPALPMRYGIAYEAEIFVGKVLSNQGSGGDGGILAGMNWAIDNGCQIISMSLGAATSPGESYRQFYEDVAQRALRQGTIIIAAAGNDSRNRSTGKRFSPPRPVSSPANCPSIMAVAALDTSLQIAAFSNGSINPQGGQIDIAAPGVDIYSTWSTDPRGAKPSRYRTISGTSMATPHVAGIAALHAEATGKRGVELWAVLIQQAQRLSLPSVDVGNGLVQAPL